MMFLSVLIPTRPATARAALEAGADILNDVWARDFMMVRC